MTQHIEHLTWQPTICLPSRKGMEMKIRDKDKTDTGHFPGKSNRMEATGKNSNN